MEKANRRKKSSVKPSKTLKYLFIACLCTVGLISLFDENETVSMRENRTLKTFPAFSFSGLLDGSYLKQCEEAYNDTFPARESFINAADGVRAVLTWEGENGVLGTAKATEDEETMSEEEAEALRLAEEARRSEAERQAEEARLAAEAAGEEAERQRLEELARLKTWPEYSDEGYEQFIEKELSPNVILVSTDREDGSTDYRAMRIFQKSRSGAKAIVSIIHAMADAFPDSRIVPILPPTASCFYADEQYRTGAYSQEDWMELIYRNLPEGMAKPDLISAMKEHTDEELFFRSDHHWTQLGAWYVYDLLCRELGLGESAKPEELESVTYEGYIGNLSGDVICPRFYKEPESNTVWLPGVTTEVKAMKNRSWFPADWTDIPIYSKRVTTSYHLFFDGDYSLLDIKTDAGTGRSALILKDSFANCLIPWFTNTYDHIAVMDPRHLNTTPDNIVLAQEYFAEEHFDEIYLVHNLHGAGTATYAAGFSRLLIPEVNEAFKKEMGRA